jgi:hypothetical protein
VHRIGLETRFLLVFRVKQGELLSKKISADIRRSLYYIVFIQFLKSLPILYLNTTKEQVLWMRIHFPRLIQEEFRPNVKKIKIF